MLRTEHVEPFRGVEHFQYLDGFIVWRRGTGDNVEILHLKVETKRKGTGRILIKEMLRRLKGRPPYYTIFGFTRSCNWEGRAFYRAMGFKLTKVKGVYKDGDAVVFSAPYEELYERLCNDRTNS